MTRQNKNLRMVTSSQVKDMTNYLSWTLEPLFDSTFWPIHVTVKTTQNLLHRMAKTFSPVRRALEGLQLKIPIPMVDALFQRLRRVYQKSRNSRNI